MKEIIKMTSEKRLTVGIPGYKSPGAEFFGGGINHLDYCDAIGNVRIIMPHEEKVEVDLLYLPGGLDLSPDAYGEVPKFKTSNQDVMKEFFYRNRLKNYVGNTPIFGVCLGMQMLGAYFGSKLTQNLMFHEQSEERGEGAHKVSVVNPFNNNFKKGMKFEVNSHHHQCILKSQLSDDLEVLAFSENHEPLIDAGDFIVESFRHKELPIAGVQWHPEEWWDTFSFELLASVIYQNKK